MTSNHELISRWGTWMRAEGLARRTIKDRTEMLRRLAAAGIDVRAATSDDLAIFLGDGDWMPATRNNYYRCMKAWYLWLVRQGIRLDNPVDLIRAPRVPRAEPRPVDSSELAVALRLVNRRRTRGMLYLAAYQGLRVHEIAKHRGEFMLQGGRIRVLGKGGTDKVLPVHPAVAEIAAQFPREGFWFPSYTRPGQPITSQNVSAVLAQLMRRAGAYGATAHRLRHWYGTELLDTSGNARVTQELLRHSQLNTVQIYTRVKADRLREAIERLPAPERLIAELSSRDVA